MPEAIGAGILRFDPDRIGKGLWLLRQLCEVEDWGTEPVASAELLPNQPLDNDERGTDQ